MEVKKGKEKWKIKRRRYFTRCNLRGLTVSPFVCHVVYGVSSVCVRLSDFFSVFFSPLPFSVCSFLCWCPTILPVCLFFFSGRPRLTCVSLCMSLHLYVYVFCLSLCLSRLSLVCTVKEKRNKARRNTIFFSPDRFSGCGRNQIWNGKNKGQNFIISSSCAKCYKKKVNCLFAFWGYVDFSLFCAFL